MSLHWPFDRRSDRTVRVVRVRRRPSAAIAASLLIGLVSGVGAGAALWLRSPGPATPVNAPPSLARPPGDAIPRPDAAPARIPVIEADETDILRAPASALQVFRVRAAPRVLVLSFPTLRDQGMTFSRLGAFVEKAGLPRDRVLSDPELDAAILRAGDTVDTYYYGYDFSAADAARFFAVAARDGVALRPEEIGLRALLEQEGMLAPGATGAVISIPPASATPAIDPPERAAILHHELSHGAYFTDAAYADYARQFWRAALTEAERSGFRRFLAGQDYDATNEDLMLNEAQAYLIHTPNARFFQPAAASLSDVEAARLRDAFIRGMPDGWMKPRDWLTSSSPGNQ